MFESAELGHKLSKDAFKALEKSLRPELLNAQFSLVESQDYCLLIVINGADFSGKLALAHRICEWTDVHYLTTLAFSKPTAAEKKMPALQRYWRALPKRGRIGLVLGSWYNQPISDYVDGKLSSGEFIEALNELREFEYALAAERVHVLKIWLDLSEDELKSRRKAARKSKKTVSPMEEWESLEALKPEKLNRISEHVVAHTSSHWSPWQVVSADNANYRDACSCQLILKALQQPHVEPPGDSGSRIVSSTPLDGKTLLNTLDLSKRLDKPEYDKQLDHWQSQLTELVNGGALKNRAALLVFEGSDAAGKGGCIRRITKALDPRQFTVHSISAPSEDESLRPYLWRFWQRIPHWNHLTIFDRSYYGRVLVERVEGFATEASWQRAYSEIRDFEAQLNDAGILVVKFWLQISADEQLKRFRDREAQPHKRHKLTREDWRNRDRWDDYQRAACEMFDRTSTSTAPWHIVSAEHKRYARIEVLKHLVKQIEQ